MIEIVYEEGVHPTYYWNLKENSRLPNTAGSFLSYPSFLESFCKGYAWRRWHFYWNSRSLVTLNQ
ncbi:hypothetical protein B5F24_06270 [Bacteroides clarus]|uniref:Uncharacterized protein n=1 Tax=Bacteroides clarus TaxID=626929 RepID=A0A1Y4JXL5_9BACE|nr:hypothetical protein B5F24_06270 [Bacteroides clarus]